MSLVLTHEPCQKLVNDFKNVSFSMELESLSVGKT